MAPAGDTKGEAQNPPFGQEGRVLQEAVARCIRAVPTPAHTHRARRVRPELGGVTEVGRAAPMSVLGLRTLLSRMPWPR